jgi:hypothetical protein
VSPPPSSRHWNSSQRVPHASTSNAVWTRPRYKSRVTILAEVKCWRSSISSTRCRSSGYVMTASRRRRSRGGICSGNTPPVNDRYTSTARGQKSPHSSRPGRTSQGGATSSARADPSGRTSRTNATMRFLESGMPGSSQPSSRARRVIHRCLPPRSPSRAERRIASRLSASNLAYVAALSNGPNLDPVGCRRAQQFSGQPEATVAVSLQRTPAAGAPRRSVVVPSKCLSSRYGDRAGPRGAYRMRR